MNERIRELAEQAYVNVITTNGLEHIVDGCYIISPDKLEKFAQLIVQECVGVADHSNITSKSIIGQRIKEHFGVEE